MLSLLDRVKTFLDADPSQAHATGAHGIPLLYHAVIRGHKDIAGLLLARGADVNANEGGNPALHGAVLFGQTEMTRWLLDHGANVNALNYENKTPLRVAMEKDWNELADLLRQYRGHE